MTDYKSIFEEAEKTLKKQSWFSEMEFDAQYGRFKKFENKKRTDQELFELLVLIIFYSGFRAATIEQKENVILGHLSEYSSVALFDDSDVNRILLDTRMVKNKRKSRAAYRMLKRSKTLLTNMAVSKITWTVFQQMLRLKTSF